MSALYVIVTGMYPNAFRSEVEEIHAQVIQPNVRVAAGIQGFDEFRTRTVPALRDWQAEFVYNYLKP